MNIFIHHSAFIILRSSFIGQIPTPGITYEFFGQTPTPGVKHSDGETPLPGQQ
jgi:hypothetical protein